MDEELDYIRNTFHELFPDWEKLTPDDTVNLSKETKYGLVKCQGKLLAILHELEKELQVYKEFMVKAGTILYKDEIHGQKGKDEKNNRNTNHDSR